MVSDPPSPTQQTPTDAKPVAKPAAAAEKGKDRAAAGGMGAMGVLGSVLLTVGLVLPPPFLFFITLEPGVE